MHVHSLPDLDDVTLAGLADGQVLTWDSGAGQWVNETPTAPPAATAPTGSITAYAGTLAPSGWLLCDGSAIPRGSALGLVIGTAFGVGDGATTCNLPDLRGRFVLGVSGAHARGTTGGVESVTLTAAQSGLAAHEHTYQGHTHNSMARTNTDAATGSNEVNAGLATTGGAAQGASASHENMPPYQAITWIIKD